MSGHIIKRQGRFAWRRSIRGITIQVPLRTSCPREAAETGAAATAASYAVFDDMLHNRLDRDAGRAIIERAAITAAARRTLRGQGLFFFFGQYLPPRSLRQSGHSEAEIRHWIRSRPAPADEDLADWDPQDIAEYRAILDAPSEPETPAAPAPAPVIIHKHYHAPAAVPAETPAFVASAALASAPAPVVAKPEAAAPVERVVEALVAPARTPIAALVETVIESDARRNRVNAATSAGFRTSINLFCEVCRISDAEDITQARIVEFCAALDRLPPDYRRGSKGRATPIWDIIEKEKADGVETGLSAKTVNKQLEAVQKLIRHARAHGVNLPGIELSILRVRDDEAAKEKRYPFTQDDIRRLFEQPGLNLSSERGALWWNAHLAAYTGARREEIAGLDVADIETVNDIPVIHIRTNAHRSLKNGQSGRMVPVHPDLIALGFLDYANGRKPGLLFDVKRKGRTFGNDFEYGWQKVRKAVIGADDKKTFHSFRHSAVQALTDAGIPLNVRADLFGHDHEHIEGKIYGGQLKTSILFDAVKLLPSVR